MIHTKKFFVVTGNHTIKLDLIGFVETKSLETAVFFS
jgi:hypothetical protein